MKPWIVIGLLLVTACSSDRPEDAIRSLIEAVATAAEDDDISVFRSAIADDYTDLRENDKSSIINMARGIMLRSNDLYVFTDIEDVTLVSENFATATVSARFAGADWKRLQLRGSQYSFELELRKSRGDWQITTARWAGSGETPR